MGDTGVLTLRSGASLHYGHNGAGPPLILLHGSPGSGHAWSRVVKHLPRDAHILTPDLPGYGESDPLPQMPLEQRTKAMAQAIAELIEHCAEPVWLCGHSYGGNVALHAALLCRHRIKGLVLLEPVFMRALDLAGQAAALSEARAFFTSYLVRVEFAEPDAVGLMFDFWMGDGTYAGLPAKQKYFLNEAAAKNAQDVRASFAETTTAAELLSLDLPVAISFGDASPPLARHITQSLAGLLPRADVSVIAGATHGMLDTHPADVAHFISRFCKSRVAVS
jgi:pimeloyl-ACP methyl ester carboxylesterase